MAWYRCSCGLLKEEAPRIGDTIVSIYHLHRSAGPGSPSVIVLMEEVPAPPPDRDVPLDAKETASGRGVSAFEAEKSARDDEVLPLEAKESAGGALVPHRVESVTGSNVWDAGTAARTKRDFSVNRKLHR